MREPKKKVNAEQLFPGYHSKEQKWRPILTGTRSTTECKENVRYFLADMKFSVSFDDMIMAMTVSCPVR